MSNTYQSLLHRRSLRDTSNPFECSGQEFLETYHISKEMAYYLIEKLQDFNYNRLDWHPPHIKVLSSMQLLCDGSFQQNAGGNQGINIAETTVRRYLAQFTAAVNEKLMPEWINFPATEGGRRKVAKNFQTKCIHPNIIGAVGYTHINIVPPAKPNDQFVNKKGKFSLFTQLIVDADCRILHVNARYPGHCHKQTVFDNCNVRHELKRLFNQGNGKYFLLGDSGYKLEPWLITPVVNGEVDSPDDRYTQWHSQVLDIVERTISYLKANFKMLDLKDGLHYNPTQSSITINACATLYNLMLHYGIPLEEGPLDDMSPSMSEGGDDEIVVEQDETLLAIAEAKRNSLIKTHFM